jgi:hypothetical protein
MKQKKLTDDETVHTVYRVVLKLQLFLAQLQVFIIKANQCNRTESAARNYGQQSTQKNET